MWSRMVYKCIELMCAELGRPFDRSTFPVPDFVIEELYGNFRADTKNMFIKQFYGDDTELLCPPDFEINQKSAMDPFATEWNVESFECHGLHEEVIKQVHEVRKFTLNKCK